MSFHESYRLTDDVLGKGSYGEVKRAVHNLSGQNYAVKTICSKNMRVSLSSFFFLNQENFQVVNFLTFRNNFEADVLNLERKWSKMTFFNIYNSEKKINLCICKKKKNNLQFFQSFEFLFYLRDFEP